MLVLAAALVLPWAAWQLVQQLEALLREGQERAQLDAARALARAVAATLPELESAEAALFVHDAGAPILVDGSGDDWRAYPPARSDDGDVTLSLAADARALHALIEVRDATRVRADAGHPLGLEGDRFELVLRDPYGQREWTLGNAAPGTLQVAGAAAGPIGEWQETAEGYRIELSLPRPAEPAALALRRVDANGTIVARSAAFAAGEAPLPLVRADPRWSRVLAAFAPARARLRVVSPDGWVLARAGELASSSDGAPPGRWQGLLYRVLLAPPIEASAEFAPERARLDAAVVWQALSGLPASAVRAGGDAGTVILAAAVPIGEGERVHGALLLEQPGDALLVLANRAVFGVLAASLLAVLLAALVVLAYGGVQSWRIRRLRNAAERALTPDGRIEPHVPLLAARDDLGDLARSFARLLGEIGAYTDYLRTLGSKLSHELHTPLAIVRSSLDNLEHEALSPGARVYAERARAGADRLNGILRAMSEASRVERAIAGAEGEDFDLAELVRQSGEAYRDLVAPRRLELDVPAGPLVHHGAPDLVAQALDKLVDNARSFAPPDGWIRIALARAGDAVELTVANQGPTLPERMEERVFDSLVSLRETRAQGDAAPHLGLGLFIVRLVADLHGGEARASNLAGGEGVAFVLRLRGMPRRRL